MYILFIHETGEWLDGRVGEKKGSDTLTERNDMHK